MKKTAFTILWTLITVLAVPVKSAQGADIPTLEAQAGQYLYNLYAEMAPGARTIITVTPVNQHLRNKRCNTPVTFNHAPVRGSRASLKALCSSPKWSVYMTASIEQWQKIAVSSRALSKDTILGDSDLFMKEFDIRRTRSPYFVDPGEVIGRTTKRAIGAQQVISPNALEKKLLIRKGDLVYIEARQKGMMIRMMGVAKQDGSQGEQIAVENTRSGKTIRGYVTGKGVIRVSR